MISAAAPPLAHASQHQDGGSDEIVATGLTGAGGIALGDFSTLALGFESTSGFSLVVTGTGSNSVGVGGISISTGATAGSTSRCSKDSASATLPTGFTVAQVMTAHVLFQADSTKFGTLWLVKGRDSGNPGFGFRALDGVLYGYTGDGATPNYVSLQTLSTSSYQRERALKAVFTPGVNCKFYVDNVLLGTSTSNLPSGLGSQTEFLWALVENNAVAENKKMTLHSYCLQY